MTLAATPKAFTSHICKGKWRFEKRKMSGNAVNTKSSQLKCGCQFSTQLLTIAATSSGTAPEKHASAMSVARTSSGDQQRTLCALICSVSARSPASPPVKTLRTIGHDSNDLHRTDIVGNAEARFAKDLLGRGESPAHLAHSDAVRESGRGGIHDIAFADLRILGNKREPRLIPALEQRVNALFPDAYGELERGVKHCLHQRGIRENPAELSQ